MDINDIMYVHIDRKRKLPVTTFLRALGFSKSEEILSIFHDTKEIKVDEESVGEVVLEDVVLKKTGEVVVEAYSGATRTHTGERENGRSGK